MSLYGQSGTYIFRLLCRCAAVHAHEAYIGQSDNLPMGYLAGTVICKFLSIPNRLKLRRENDIRYCFKQ